MPLFCRDIYSFRQLCCTASNTSVPQLCYQSTNCCLLQVSFEINLKSLVCAYLVIAQRYNNCFIILRLRVRVQLPLFPLGDNNKKIPLQCRDIYSFRFLCCTASNTSVPQMLYQGTNICLLQVSFKINFNSLVCPSLVVAQWYNNCFVILRLRV